MNAWTGLIADSRAPKDWGRAVALYSVRADANRDLPGTLERLSELGYRAIEARGCGEAQARQVRRTLDAAGLDCPAVTLEPQPSPVEQLAGAIVLGARYLSIPAAPNYFEFEGGSYRWRDSVPSAEFANFAASLAPFAQQCHDKGCHLLYHLHDRDYLPLDNGFTVVDMLLGRLPADLLSFEVDTAWLVAARVDLPGVLAKLRGRVRTVHIKDLDPSLPTEPRGRNAVPPGRGQVDLVPLLATLRAYGATHGFVELEPFGDPWLNLGIARDWLQSRGLWTAD